MGRTARAARGRRGSALSVVLVTALTAAVLATAPVGAHGIGDQETPGASGTEACSAAEYPGSKLVTLGESRQSFVPSRGGLVAIEVCIQNLVGVPGTDFRVNLYEGGSASSPGPRIASQPVDVGLSLLGARWVHVDLPVEIPTTPGGTYVLGLDPTAGVLSSVSFQWRATCANSLLTSCAGVPDAYPQGNTNDLPGNADYAFRTFPGHDADLVGEVTVDDPVCPGLDLTDSATGTVHNVSATSVGPFRTEWLWSADGTLDAADRLLTSTPHQVAGLPAGGSVAVPPPTLPDDLAMGEGHLLLHIDVDGQVVESDDSNNVAAAPTSVTACGQPSFDSLSLSVDEDVVEAGVHQVQFSDLDPAALATLPQSPLEAQANPGISPNGFSPNGFSPNGFSPNGFSANGFSPNGFSPNGFSPAGDVLLRDVLRDLPPQLTELMLVVNIPIVGPGWTERLATVTDAPLQDVTLARASALLPDLTVGEVDLTRVFTMSWLGLALANGALADTPLPEGKSWCALLADFDFSCAALGINPAVTSLLGLEATGFPTHRAAIADRPLDTISLDADFLVFAMPLGGKAGFSLEHTRLGRVPADEALTDASTVVDCDAYDCSRPLAEAASAGALRDVTVGTLVRGLTPAGLARGTVGDLAMGMASLDSLQLSRANWNLADPYYMDDECARVTYRVGGHNDGTADAVDPTLTLELPPGFAYVPLSVALHLDGGSGLPQSEPTLEVADDGTRTYRFALDAIIEGSFELVLSACAGSYLGHVAAGHASLEGIGLGGAYGADTSSSPLDVVQVVERTPGVTTLALAHDDNVVVFDHIASANHADSWTFEVKPEPQTMYIVKLHPPIGTDLDLIGYAPGISANGFSANGFSPNGFSPNGFSPNGFSANGFSPNGFSANGFSPNGFSPNGFSSTASPDLVDDLAVSELAPPGASGHAISANRGDTPETLYMFSTFGDEGSFTFTVTDYNGARSDAPYVLTVQSVRPEPHPGLGDCQAAPWDLSHAPGSAPATWNGPQPPRSLFVVNRQVTASAYGTAATDTGIAALRQLAARPEVRGIVLEVDHHPDVRAAYAGWRDDWCNPTAANITASHVRSQILDLRAQHPSIDTIVLAGPDSLLPDFRLRDGSVLANEVHYAETLLKATGGNNALVAAFVHGTIPSSDPYGNEHPLPFGTTYAFPPSAGVSRLVETPGDWVAQKEQYVASDGTLDPASGFISAETGMVDGAHAAADVLAGRGVSMERLTDEAGSWTANAFRQGAFGGQPDIAGYNAHTNHFALLSADGSARGDYTELVRSDESGGIPFGSLVFSNGCHFGTSVPDILNTDPSPDQADRLLDWNQAISQRRGIAVTNSGFGIFDTEVVGQGELLQLQFLEETATAPNVAVALARAKNRFFASPGVYDPYSYKVLQQLSMYGLGIFTMLGAEPAPELPAPPPETASLDVSVGPYTVDTTGTGTCTDCYLLTEGAHGTKVELIDGDHRTGNTSTSGYWSAPLSVQEHRLPPGKLSAGLWVNGIDSVTLDDVDPVITRLAVNRSDRETESQTAAPFPTALGTVNDVGGTAVTTLLHGINVPHRMSNGKVRSDVHLYTHVDAEVLLRPDTTVGCTPHIDEVTVVHSEDGSLALLDVVAGTQCGPNLRAAALGRDDTGSWTYRELTQGANGHWTGAMALTGGATELEDLHVQVSNGLGVGHWRNKGDKPLVHVAAVNGVDLLLAGDRHPSGIFLGDVTATVIGTAGTAYRVYDNDHLVGTFVHGDSFVISGDGAHVIEVLGGDGSGYRSTIAIDGSTPSIDLRTPPPGASYLRGQEVPLDVACADTGTGSTCTALNDGQPITNGALLNTGTLGEHTIEVTATDHVGNTTTLTRTYTVVTGYVASAFMSPVRAKPHLNNVSAGSTIAVKFTVTDSAGNELTNPAIVAERAWRPIVCNSKAPTGPEFPAAGTNPQYSGFFHFNVAAPTGTGCYELIVRLDDGTPLTAYFQVKK